LKIVLGLIGVKKMVLGIDFVKFSVLQKTKRVFHNFNS